MAEKIYEHGTIKVVWIENDVSRIFSRMFTQVDEAVKFASGKPDSVIYKLVRQENMEEFEWEILPYGRVDQYKLALSLYKKYGEKIMHVLKSTFKI